MPSTDRFARRLARLEQEVKALGSTPQLAYSSVEDGAVGVRINGQYTMQIGLQHDGTSTSAVLTGPRPPVPTVALVTPVPAGLTVYWDGTFADGSVAPMDFARVTVHAVPADIFTEYDPLDQRFIIGAIAQATGGEVSAHLAPQPYVVYLAAWSESGNFSDGTYFATGEPLPAGGMTPEEVADQIAVEIDAVNASIAAGDSANATALDNAVDDYIARIAAEATLRDDADTLIMASVNGKNTVTHSAVAPGTTANTAGDVWFQYEDSSLTNIIAQYRGTGGTGWVEIALDPVVIPQLDIGTGTFGTLSGLRVNAAELTIGQSQVTGLDSALAGKETAGAAAALQNLWGDPVDSTKIAGGNIMTRSVSADKLLVSDFTNYVRDGDMANIGSWTAVSGAFGSGIDYFTTTSGADGVPDNVIRFTAAGAALEIREASFKVTPGDAFNMSAWLRYVGTTPTAGLVYMSLFFYDKDGVSLGTATGNVKIVNATDIPAAGAYFNANVTVPGGAASAVVGIRTSSSVTTGTKIDVDRLRLRRRFGGELIVDGSILAKHATADLVEGLLVTGRVLQTDAAASAGIKISTSGLVGYNNTTGAPGTVIDPTTGTLSMFDGTLTGGLFQSSSTEKTGVKVGSVNGTVGIFAYNPAGDVFFKAVPSEGVALVAGEVKAKSLTVSSDDPANPPTTSLGGRVEIGAGGYVILTAGVTAPASAPTVTTGYDTMQFADDGSWPYRRGLGWDGTYYYTMRLFQSVGYLEKWSSAGALVSTSTAGNSVPASSVYGVGVNAGKAYSLQRDPSSGNTTIARWNIATMAEEATATWLVGAPLRTPAISVDPANGNVVTANSVSSPTTAIQFQRFASNFADGATLTPASSVQGSIAYVQSLGGFYVGNGDLGAARFITTGYAYTDEIASYTQAGSYQGLEAWPAGTATSKIGLTYNSTLGQFVVLDPTGLLRRYTDIEKTAAAGAASLTKWVSNTLAFGATPTYETDQSPRYKITMGKRQKMTVTTSAIVGSGSNPPDRVKIYVGSGTTDPGRAAMQRLSTQPAAGVVTQDYVSLATSAVAPPASNTFPAGTGSSLAGTYFSGGVRTEATFITNTGSIPASPFRDAIDARVTAIAPSAVAQPPTGSITMYGGTGAPSGWLFCQGQAVSRTTYAALYAAIGTNFGVGDGSTTFNLPDYRQRFPFGFGPSVAFGQTEQGSGATSGAGDIARMDHTHDHTISGQANAATTRNSGTAAGTSPSTADYNGHAHGGKTGSGSAIGVGTVHAYVTTNFIIKT